MLSLIERRLTIYQSPWIVEELGLQGQYELKPVSLGQLDKVLHLNKELFPDDVLDSIYHSDWYLIDNGRMVVEVRNPAFAKPPLSNSLASKQQGDVVHFMDLDDCLFSASRWHLEEYERVETSTDLRTSGVMISSADAKKIYELSKVEVPGKVKFERRYTPQLNLALLSVITEALEGGMDSEVSWEHMLKYRDYLVSSFPLRGEEDLDRFPVDPRILSIFANNSPADFVYEELVGDLLYLRDQQDKDIRVIATRGKIEGFLGQIYKLHASRIMTQDVDLVIYSNDVKVESLVLLSQLIPWIKAVPVRVFDDNPAEVLPYRELVLERGIPNVEIIRVLHPDAKRKEEKLQIEPGISSTSGNIRFDHFFPIETLFSLY